MGFEPQAEGDEGWEAQTISLGHGQCDQKKIAKCL